MSLEKELTSGALSAQKMQELSEAFALVAQWATSNNMWPELPADVYVARLCGAKKRKNQNADFQLRKHDQVVLQFHGEYFIAAGEAHRYRKDGKLVEEENYFRASKAEAKRALADKAEKDFVKLATKVGEEFSIDV
jgi:hypothetical protein